MLLRTVLCAAICETYRRVASPVASPVAYKDVASVASVVGCAVDSTVDSVRELAGTPRLGGFCRFAKCSGFPTSPGSDSAPVQHRIDSATDLGSDARSVIHRCIRSGSRSTAHTAIGTGIGSVSRTRSHHANAQ